ncbi:MAG: L,D-transpeptidase family protein [Campylobacterota bacterium]|nr:L,D-transpeptidase family protein [Campylobacterota bacterium]
MKLIISILFILFNTVYAQQFDLVQLYRDKGLAEVEKKLNEELTKYEYWQYYLSSKDVSNGYYESIRYIMICEKDLKDMRIYDAKEKRHLFSSSVYTGKINGDKHKEGDLKTPVGAYHLTKKLKNVDSFYGPLAITTNYPNIFDKVRGKTGHGIWIHGVPNDERREEFTKGCIALDNGNIKRLDRTINIDNSMLVISESEFVQATTNEISAALSSLFKWRLSWEKGDYDTYISFYNKNFKRTNGYDLKQFKRYKKRIFDKNEKKEIKFSNINVIPYPNENNIKLFKIVLDEVYKTKTHTFEGKKELYVQIKDNKFSILTES